MWANMAARFGLTAANDDLAYTTTGRAAGLLGTNKDAIPELAYLFCYTQSRSW